MVTLELTTGQRKFINTISQKISFPAIITTKEIKQFFPNLNSNVFSVYISSLAKKEFLFKIQNGLYYIPQITFTYSKIDFETLARYSGFKYPIKISEDWDNKTIWVGLDKRDKEHLVKLKKLYKAVTENTDDKIVKGLNEYLKIKTITKQDVVKPRAKAWTKMFETEIDKRKKA